LPAGTVYAASTSTKEVINFTKLRNLKNCQKPCGDEVAIMITREVILFCFFQPAFHFSSSVRSFLTHLILDGLDFYIVRLLFYSDPNTTYFSVSSPAPMFAASTGFLI